MTVESLVAELHARALLRRLQLSCECPAPLPGVFDVFGYTTCQHCEKQLSLKNAHERRI